MSQHTKLNDLLSEIEDYLEENKEELKRESKYSTDGFYYPSIDDVKETLEYGKVTYGKYDCAFLGGYSGSEGGGEDVSFICRINDQVFHVPGFYASWDGGEIYWNDGVEVTPEEETLTIKRTNYKDSEGEVLFVRNEDVK